MMEQPNNVVGSKRTRWITLRVNEEEYRRLYTSYEGSTCVKMSDYLRTVLFGKVLTVKTRDRSMDDFMEELILLRVELNALGNNFNQVVRKINSAKFPDQLAIWVQVASDYQQEIIERTAVIQQKIEKFSEQWLQ